MAMYFRIFYARESFIFQRYGKAPWSLLHVLFLTLAQCDILSKEYSHVILRGRIKVTQLPGIKTVNQRYIMTSLRNVLKIIIRQACLWTLNAIKLCFEFWLPSKICTHSPQLCVKGLFACFVLQRSWLNFMCWSRCDSPWGHSLARL